MAGRVDLDSAAGRSGSIESSLGGRLWCLPACTCARLGRHAAHLPLHQAHLPLLMLNGRSLMLRTVWSKRPSPKGHAFTQALLSQARRGKVGTTGRSKRATVTGSSPSSRESGWTTRTQHTAATTCRRKTAPPGAMTSTAPRVPPPQTATLTWLQRSTARSSGRMSASCPSGMLWALTGERAHTAAPQLARACSSCSAAHMCYWGEVRDVGEPLLILCTSAAGA